VTFSETEISASTDMANSVYAADVDGDGDIDVLSASLQDDKIAWYENDGNETFTGHVISSSANGVQSVYAADVDGDGDMDVLAALGYDNKIAWYENDGNQNFTAHVISTSANWAQSVYAADVDGDGDMDVLSASRGDDKIAWYENDGNQSFTTHVITTSADDAHSVYAADVDGDGDLDVLSASAYDDKIAWYENDGNQNFTTRVISTSADSAYSVYAADVDGDGDMDVLSASRGDDKIAWYENDGSQNFTTRVISTSADGAVSVYAADVDGDGDMDVLSASYSDKKIAWYENDGSEIFSTRVITTDAYSAKSVYAADVDGDGDMDVLSASRWDDKIAWYENDGSEIFSTRVITPSAYGAISVYAADVDGDGDTDMLSASKYDDKIAWYENDGNQNFTAHVITTSADGASSVYAADVDNDGDMDVLSGSIFDDKIAWYENDGNENFTAHNITTLANGAYSLYAVDIDGDGDLDVLSASAFDDKIAWYENDGNQNFTPWVISTSADSARSVYAADVDSDGDMDVLSASTNDDKIAWYENDGNQNFTARVISTSADWAYSVYAADVDGDGDMDVLSASKSDNKIAWYENDGNQNFTAHVITTSAERAASVYAADVDGDGDLDVLSASTWDNKIAWYENDGNQNFTARVISTSASRAHSVYAADVDGDGDPDVFSASKNDDKIAWYENQKNQYVAQETDLVFNSANGNLVEISDADAGSETLQTTLSVISGTLRVAAGSGAAVSNDGTATVTIVGTVAQTNAALAGMIYRGNRNFNGPDTLTVVTSDQGNTGSGGALSDTHTVDITVNGAPTLRGLNNALFDENTVNNGPQIIDSDVTVTDVDSTDFKGGSLTVSVGGLPEDSLSIRNQQGGGVGQIGFNGTTVTFGGNTIGTIRGTNNGAAGNDLIIDFTTANATPAATKALIENLTYANSSDTPTAGRTLTVTLTDGDGGTTQKIAHNRFINNDGFFEGLDVGFDAIPSLADIDGDGDLDLFIGKRDGSIGFFRNIGSEAAPIFTQISGGDNPFDGVDVGRYSRPTFVDIDNDGDLDAFIGEKNGTINFFRNKGDANIPKFKEVTGGNNPFDGVDVGRYSTPSFVDIDNDDDLDAFIGEKDGTINFFRNKGDADKPKFKEVIGGANPFDGVDVGRYSTPTFVDIDNDDDLDAFIGEKDGTINFFRNKGDADKPEFKAVTSGNNPLDGVDVGYFSTLALADLDGDGDADALSGAGDGGIVYYRNDGTPATAAFRALRADPFADAQTADNSAAALVDIDNDGDLDAFVGDYSGYIHFFRNHGDADTPDFREVTGAANPFDGVDVGAYSTPTFVDIDNDGDLDAFIGEKNGTINFFRNKGDADKPKFKEVTGGANPFDGVDVGRYSTPTFVDIDNDDDLDAFIGEKNGTVNFFRNKGDADKPKFKEVTSAANPFDGVDVGAYSTPTFVDIDNDGDFDAFIGEKNGTINFFRNKGDADKPKFKEVTGGNNPFNNLDIGYYAAPTFADIDNDGDLDAVVGTSFGRVRFFKNDGTAAAAVFGNVETPANPLGRVDIDVFSPIGGDGITQGLSTPTFADIDNDGDLDAFVGAYLGAIGFFRNDGIDAAPAFREISGSANPFDDIYLYGNSTPSFVDIDNDGDLDVFVGNNDLYSESVVFLRNDPIATAPAFTLLTGADNPLSGVSSTYTAPRFVDIDNDGDFDAFIGELYGSISFWRNEGDANTPNFTQVTGTGNPLNGVDVGSYSKPAFSDIDGDGDFDAVIGAADGTINFYRNHGDADTPDFREVTGAANPFDGADLGSYSAPAWADIDNDGDAELFVGERTGKVNLLDPLAITVTPINDAPMITRASIAGRNDISTSADGADSVYAADLDGDGDIDVLSASYNDNTIAWYENDGNQYPTFTTHDITTTAGKARSVYAADVDGDGDLDVLSASFYDNTIAWYENDGNQNFTAHDITTAADGANSVIAADVDGDGDLDVLSTSAPPFSSSTIAWYENDGNQNFRTRVISTATYGARSVHAADVDGDGDIDVLSASSHYNYGSTLAWYENDGNQSFTAQVITASADGANSVYAADMDGDGDMDVLSASSHNYFGSTIAWYENDGNQSFTAQVFTTSADGANSVYAADVDGDGDLDVLSASFYDDTIAWYENDGNQNPTFRPHEISTAADGARSVYAADVDGDGDLDVLSASFYDDKIAWYENQRNQSVSEDTDLVFSAANSNLIQISDGDAGSGTLRTTLSVTNGTLTVTAGRGATVSNDGSASVTIVGTVDQTNAALAGLTYRGTTDFSGADTLTVTTNDQGNTGPGGAQSDTYTVDITVTPVNDAPTIIGDLAATVAEGGTVTITTTDLTENDPDDSGTGLTYTVTGAPGNGQLELSTNAGTAITSFTQDDLDNSRVRYVHIGGETTADSFDFSLADGGEDGASAANGTFNVTITPVNDAPVIAGDLAATVAEGGTVTITTTDLTENDPDDSGTGLTYTVTGAPGNGQLELSSNAGMAITSFTQDDLDNNRVRYVHNGGETTSDTFNFTLADGGENSAVVDTGVFNITVTSVNDAPVIGNLNGDTVVTLPGNGVNVDVGGNTSITDVDSADFDGGVLTITRTNGTSIGGFGTDGVAVTSGGDATFGFGETVSTNGTAIGTVTAAGQDADNLTIALNADATPARLATLVQNLNYTKSASGTDTFALTISEADGTTSLETVFNAISVPPADMQSLLGGGNVSGVSDLLPGFNGLPVPEIVRAGLVSGADAINPLAPNGFGFSADGSVGPMDIYMASGQDFEFAIPDNALPDSFLNQTLNYAITSAGGSPLPPWLQFDPANGTFSGNTGDADIDQLDIQVVVRTPGGQETVLEFRILFTGQGADTLQPGTQAALPAEMPLGPHPIEDGDNGLNPETVANASVAEPKDTGPKAAATADDGFMQKEIPLDMALLGAISQAGLIPALLPLNPAPAATPGFSEQIQYASDRFERERLGFLAEIGGGREI
jgi:hypothetical protein